jgi:NAD(P)-dependent dehydrogenase (short-subunit alcohol dehydrogenase family)
MSQRFQGKRILVTGAASGMGRAAALRFANEGAKVFCACSFQAR